MFLVCPKGHALPQLDRPHDNVLGVVEPQDRRGLSPAVRERRAACSTDGYTTEKETSAGFGPLLFFCLFVTSSVSRTQALTSMEHFHQNATCVQDSGRAPRLPASCSESDILEAGAQCKEWTNWRSFRPFCHHMREGRPAHQYVSLNTMPIQRRFFSGKTCSRLSPIPPSNTYAYVQTREYIQH